MSMPFREKNPITEAIEGRKGFRQGPLRGNTLSEGYQPSVGQLPDEWAILLRAERPTYIVISYQTPIAWWSDLLGWTVPNVRYSPTTNRHQSAVRSALRAQEA